jgi:hypothetical protein
VTSREHLTRPQFNKHLWRVREKLRRHGWQWEHFVQVEFQRRGALHANLLVKGVRADRLADFHRAFALEWCARVDAEPVGQWAEAIDDALAVSKYCSKMLAHGLKAEQRPPLGWQGHRTSHTRGYFGRPMWQVRRDARASLQRKRELRRAALEGHTPMEAEAVADVRLLRAEQTVWELAVVEVEATGELRRVRPAHRGGLLQDWRLSRAGERRRDREENAGRALRALDELKAATSLLLPGSDPVPTTPPLFSLPRRRE